MRVTRIPLSRKPEHPSVLKAVSESRLLGVSGGVNTKAVKPTASEVRAVGR